MSIATAPAISQEQLTTTLDRLINKDRCILCFDKTLVEQLPDILVEHHRVRTSADARRHPAARALFDLVDPSHDTEYETCRLPELIQATGLDLSKWDCRGEVLPEDRNDFASYSNESFDRDLEGVLKLQSVLGQNLQYGEEKKVKPHLLEPSQVHQYLTWVTTPKRGRMERFFKCDFWTLQLRKWMMLRRLDKNAPSLSIGPRWLSEILYFRQVVGLEKHIGLDLHSEDDSLVKVGDMHDMPFGDNEFGFIFIKNTVDKSYDIRKLISEMVRVTKPGGIIAVDGNCLHGHATMLHRSDIQCAENLVPLFKAQAKVRTLVCQTIDISGQGDAAASNAKRNNARVAVKVLK